MKTKLFYQVTVLTPIKDGNSYSASIRLFETKKQADNHVAQYTHSLYITEITERHLPQY